jgi:hypothetical protein
LRCAKAKAISRVLVGVWLSPVEHCVRDAGVAGSNPATPTRYSILSTCYRDSYWDRNGSATDYLNKQGDGCAKVSAPGVCSPPQRRFAEAFGSKLGRWRPPDPETRSPAAANGRANRKSKPGRHETFKYADTAIVARHCFGCRLLTEYGGRLTGSLVRCSLIDAW